MSITYHPSRPLLKTYLITCVVALLVLCVAYLKTPGVDAEGLTAPDHTYHFNQSTGLWENDNYSWDPATGKTNPKKPTDYSYNTSTGMWDTDKWVYNPTTGKYEENLPARGPVESVGPTNPTGPTSQTGPTPSTSATSTSNKEESAAAASPQVNSTPTPPESHNPQIAEDTKNYSTSMFSGFYDATISNRIDSSSISGDAAVSNNTRAGSATTGNAETFANLINLLQSSWNLGNGFTTFTSDIKGNVVGDIYIDPRVLQQNKTQVTDPNHDIYVNTKNDGMIDNNVNLVANSGKSTVSNNTDAGAATTGNATAVANVMNVLNSIIAAQKSFLGTINIYGSLDGDIIFPPGYLETLLHDNKQDSNQTTSDLNNLAVNTTNNSSINNQITTTATSGKALIDGNTIGGSAKTGNANTQVTLLNLTGREVVGKDTILVFVNVLGKWVGLLMNAPSGSTSAAIGSSVSRNDVARSNMEVETVNNSTINNDISVASASGDATVSGNTKAGGAMTGNATASVNVVNMASSVFNLSDWFGILFINVFGSWNGSFGIDTSAGNLPTIAIPSAQNSTAQNIKVFQFIPNNSGTSKTFRAVNASYYLSNYSNQPNSDNNTHAIIVNNSSSSDGSSDNGQGILGSKTITDSGNPTAGIQRSMTLPILGFILGSMILGSEQASTRLKKHREIIKKPA